MPSKSTKGRKSTGKKSTFRTKTSKTNKSWKGTPSNYTSPFGPAFTSAINRGTPCSVAVNNIAGRTGKTPKSVFTSLVKAGLCFTQKVNGQNVYWPCNTPTKKSSSTNIKNCQNNMWQCFIDWCVCSGFTTPAKLNNCSSQAQFMSFCKKFWGKQFPSNTGSKTTGRGVKGHGKSYGPKSYKFPTFGSRSYGKRKVA